MIRLGTGTKSFAASLYRVWKTKDWWIFDLDAKKLFLALTVGDRSLLDHPKGAGGKSMDPGQNATVKIFSALIRIWCARSLAVLTRCIRNSFWEHE